MIAAATRALRDALQQAVSCVSIGVLAGQRYALENELTLLGQTVPSPGGRLILSFRHFYSIVADASRETRSRWQAHTTAYYYTLDDADGHEILAYHWHPSGRSPVTLPHLHLGAGAGTLRSELTKAHLETAFVTPVALLQLAIEQFSVRPRRADWAAVLKRARRALDAV